MNKDEIPNYPFYGYDNADELDADVSYIKGIYPQTVRKLLKEVEEECDKLEYEGSLLFDEKPDPVSIGKIVDTIYVRLAKENFAPIKTECLRPPYYPCNGRNCPPPPPPPPCNRRHCPPHPPIPDYDRDGNPEWMRNMISILLFNEMIHRRRRYRTRRRFF